MEGADAYEYNYNGNSITPSRRTLGASESFILEHSILNELDTKMHGEETNDVLPYTPINDSDLKQAPNDYDGLYYDSMNTSCSNNVIIKSPDGDNVGESKIGFQRSRSQNQGLGCKEPSVTELDKIQRNRREEIERRNAELQSFSILERVRRRQEEVNASNADVRHTGNGPGLSPEEDFFMNTTFLPNANRRGSVALRSRRRCGSGNENIFGSAFFNTNGSNSIPTATRIENSGNTFKTRYQTNPSSNRAAVTSSGFGVTQRMSKKHRSIPPPPRLNIRPHNHTHSAFQDQEQPIIIEQEEDCSNNLGELFPSPHSNKFVLQFPDAPQQELTLNDEIEEEDSISSEGDFQSSNDLDQESGTNNSDTGLGLSSPTPSSNHDVEVDFPVPFNTPICPLGQQDANCDTPNVLQQQGRGQSKTSSRGRHKASAIPAHTSPSDASSSLSPHLTNNVNSRRRRKKKILLRPKHYQGKIFDTSKTMMDIEHEDCGVSPCPSINSPATTDNANKTTTNATLKSMPLLDQFTDRRSALATKYATDDKVLFSDPSKVLMKSLDELTNELTINDHSTLPLQHNQEQQEANHKDLSRDSNTIANRELVTSNVAKSSTSIPQDGRSRRGGAFLSLRPKNGRHNVSAKPPGAATKEHISTANADEADDEVMELDPNLSLSRDADCSIHSATNTCVYKSGPQSGQHYDDTLDSTPQHLRNPSFLPTPSPTHSGPAGGQFVYHHQRQHPPNYWNRSLSSNSISDQIEMAKEAAARFGGPGPTRFLMDENLSNHSVSFAFSPSNLSESNFRTPNPESSARRKQHWFQGNIDGDDNGNDNLNHHGENTEWVSGQHPPNDLKGKESEASDKKEYKVELFLPSLFLSPSEEQSSLPSARGHCDTNSLFGKAKEALSLSPSS